MVTADTDMEITGMVTGPPILMIKKVAAVCSKKYPHSSKRTEDDSFKKGLIDPIIENH
jgi:hypothetical protein